MTGKYGKKAVSIIVLLVFAFNVIGCATTPNISKFGFESYSKDKQKEEESNRGSTNGAYGTLIGAAAGVASYFAMTKGVDPGSGGGTGMLVYLGAIMFGGLLVCVGALVGFLIPSDSKPGKVKDKDNSEGIPVGGQFW